MTGSSNSGGRPLVKKTHPIRGLLWGIPLGLGLAVVLVVTTVIPLELAQMAIVVVAAMVLGLLWGLFGPARTPRGASPAVTVADLEETQESTGDLHDSASGLPESAEDLQDSAAEFADSAGEFNSAAGGVDEPIVDESDSGSGVDTAPWDEGAPDKDGPV